MDWTDSPNCQNCIALQKKLELFSLLKAQCCRTDEIAKSLISLKKSYEKAIKALESKTKRINELKSKLKESENADENFKNVQRKFAEYQVRISTSDTKVQDLLQELEKEHRKYADLSLEKDVLKSNVEEKTNEMASLKLIAEQSEERFLSEVQALKSDLEKSHDALKVVKRDLQKGLNTNNMLQKKYDNLVTSLLDTFKDGDVVGADSLKKLKRIINRLRAKDNAAKLEAELSSPTLTPDGTISLDTGIFSGDEDIGNPSLANDLDISSESSDDEFEDVPSYEDAVINPPLSERDDCRSTQNADSNQNCRKSLTKNIIPTKLPSLNTPDVSSKECSESSRDCLIDSLNDTASNGNLPPYDGQNTPKSPPHNQLAKSSIFSPSQELKHQDVADETPLLPNIESSRAAGSSKPTCTTLISSMDFECEEITFLNQNPSLNLQSSDSLSVNSSDIDTVCKVNQDQSSCRKSLLDLENSVNKIMSGNESLPNDCQNASCHNKSTVLRIISPNHVEETECNESDVTPVSPDVESSRTSEGCRPSLTTPCSSVYLECEGMAILEQSPSRNPSNLHSLVMNSPDVVTESKSNPNQVLECTTDVFGRSQTDETSLVCAGDILDYPNSPNTIDEESNSIDIDLDFMLNEWKPLTPVLPFSEDSSSSDERNSSGVISAKALQIIDTSVGTQSSLGGPCPCNVTTTINPDLLSGEVSVGEQNICSGLESSDSSSQCLEKESAASIHSSISSTGHGQFGTNCLESCQKFDAQCQTISVPYSFKLVEDASGSSLEEIGAFESINTTSTEHSRREAATSPVIFNRPNAATSPVKFFTKDQAVSPTPVITNHQGTSPRKVLVTTSSTSPAKRVDRDSQTLPQEFLDKHTQPDNYLSKKLGDYGPSAESEWNSDCCHKEGKLIAETMEALGISVGNEPEATLNETLIGDLRHAIEMVVRKENYGKHFGRSPSTSFCLYRECEFAEICEEQHYRLHQVAKSKNFENSICSLRKGKMKIKRLCRESLGQLKPNFSSESILKHFPEIDSGVKRDKSQGEKKTKALLEDENIGIRSLPKPSPASTSKESLSKSNGDPRSVRDGFEINENFSESNLNCEENFSESGLGESPNTSKSIHEDLGHSPSSLGKSPQSIELQGSLRTRQQLSTFNDNDSICQNSSSKGMSRKSIETEDGKTVKQKSASSRSVKACAENALCPSIEENFGTPKVSPIEDDEVSDSERLCMDLSETDEFSPPNCSISSCEDSSNQRQPVEKVNNKVHDETSEEDNIQKENTCQELCQKRSPSRNRCIKSTQSSKRQADNLRRSPRIQRRSMVGVCAAGSMPSPSLNFVKFVRGETVVSGGVSPEPRSQPLASNHVLKRTQPVTLNLSETKEIVESAVLKGGVSSLPCENSTGSVLVPSSSGKKGADKRCLESEPFTHKVLKRIKSSVPDIVEADDENDSNTSNQHDVEKPLQTASQEFPLVPVNIPQSSMPKVFTDKCDGNGKSCPMDISVSGEDIPFVGSRVRRSARKPSKLQKLRSSVSKVHPLTQACKLSKEPEGEEENSKMSLVSVVKNSEVLSRKRLRSQPCDLSEVGNDQSKICKKLPVDSFDESFAATLEKFKGRECLRMAAAASGRVAQVIEVKEANRSLQKTSAPNQLKKEIVDTSGVLSSKFLGKSIKVQPLVRPEDRVTSFKKSNSLDQPKVLLKEKRILSSSSIVNAASNNKQEETNLVTPLPAMKKEENLLNQDQGKSHPIPNTTALYPLPTVENQTLHLKERSFLISKSACREVSTKSPIEIAIENQAIVRNPPCDVKELRKTEHLVATVLKEFVSVSSFTPQVLQQAVDALSSEDLYYASHVIVRDIVGMMEDDYDSSPVCNSRLNRSFVPPLSPVQQQLLTLILQLSFQKTHFKELPHQVLRLLEFRVFRLGRAPEGSRLLWCSSFYASICRALCLRSHALIFCWDALYTLKARAYEVVKAVMEVWPYLFPINPSFSQACPNAQVMLHILRSRGQKEPSPGMQVNKYYDSSWLKRLLKCAGLQTASMNSSILASTLFSNLTSDKSGASATALVLLAKSEDEQWAFQNVISGKLLPALEKWHNKSLDDSSGEQIIWTLCSILRALAPVKSANLFKTLMKLLKSDLLNKESPASVHMQEVIAIGIALLSRHDVENAALSLMQWNPKHGNSVGYSNYLIQQLSHLVGSGIRYLPWWQQLFFEYLSESHP